MDDIAKKYLEHRLGNGDTITLTREEFKELAYDNPSDIAQLEEENSTLEYEIHTLQDEYDDLQTMCEELKITIEQQKIKITELESK